MKHLYTTVLLLSLFFSTAILNAQEKKKDIQEEQFVEDLQKLFLHMYTSAKITGDLKTKCDAAEVLKTIDPNKLVPEKKDIRAYLQTLNRFMAKINNEKDTTYAKINKGYLVTRADKFITFFNKASISGEYATISDKDLKKLTQGSAVTGADLNKLEESFVTLKKVLYGSLGRWKFQQGNCQIDANSAILENGHSFPSVTWQIVTDVKIDCSCEKPNEGHKVKLMDLSYSADVKGLFASEKQSLDKKGTIKPTAEIAYMDCCSNKEISNDPFLNHVQKAVENIKRPSNAVDNKASRFSIFQEAYKGKIRLSFEAGTTVGEESDYYGINHALQAAYIFSKEEGKISFGPEVGYARFTGKKTDSGFKPDGVGFVNTKARFSYHINEWLKVGAAPGYGLGLGDNVDGGITYDVGLEATPTKNKTSDASSSTRIYYTLKFNSNVVEGGGFKSLSAGVGIKL